MAIVHGSSPVPIVPRETLARSLQFPSAQVGRGAAMEAKLDDDKVFTTYALILFAGVASVITASVMAGFATLPSPLIFVEHLALSLGFRAAYKGVAGFSWDDWSLTSDHVAEVTPFPEPASEPSITRKAA